MATGPETVYFDTGDILVTAQRVAYKSVNVPLPGVAGARVERQTRLRATRQWKPGVREVVLFPIWATFTCAVSTLAFRLIFAAAPAPPGLQFLLGVALLAMMSLTGVMLRRRLVLVPTPVWAVVLTTNRREVELFRTHHRRKAVRVVEAINRAVAGSRT